MMQMKKMMNDKELDSLFEQSAQRQKAVEQINRQVMQTVRRDIRLKVFRKWAKLLGLCFGVPMLIVLYIYVLYTFMPAMEMPLRVVTLVLPLLTLVGVYGKQIREFSVF